MRFISSKGERSWQRGNAARFQFNSKPGSAQFLCPSLNLGFQFIPVPDVGTRVSGVQAGDYDYAEYISGDLFGMLKDDAALKPNHSCGLGPC